VRTFRKPSETPCDVMNTSWFATCERLIVCENRRVDLKNPSRKQPTRFKTSTMELSTASEGASHTPARCAQTKQGRQTFTATSEAAAFSSTDRQNCSRSRLSNVVGDGAPHAFAALPSGTPTSAPSNDELDCLHLT